jgi:hypothetical protein
MTVFAKVTLGAEALRLSFSASRRTRIGTQLLIFNETVIYASTTWFADINHYGRAINFVSDGADTRQWVECPYMAQLVENACT